MSAEPRSGMAAVPSYFFLLKMHLLVGSIYVLTCVPSVSFIFTEKMILTDLSGATPVLIGSCHSMFWIGAALASLVIVPLFDVWGRRTPTYVLVAIGLLGLLMSAFSTQVYVYGMSLFLTGFTFMPACNAGYLLFQESIPEHMKAQNLVIVNTLYSSAVMLLAATAECMEHVNWRVQTLVFASPYLIVLMFGPFIIKESNKFESARAAFLAHSARSGNRKSAMGPLSEFVEQVYGLFGSDSACHLAATLVCWSACSVVYYGLSYVSGKISDNMYMNMAMLGLMDVMGYASAGPLLSKMHSRTLQMASLGGASAALFVCSLLPEGSQAQIICAFAGRLLVDFAFTTVFLLIIEVFPTQFCSGAMGLATFSSRLSTMFAPLMALIPFTLTCQIMSALGLAAAFATWTLPRPCPVAMKEGLLDGVK